MTSLIPRCEIPGDYPQSHVNAESWGYPKVTLQHFPLDMSQLLQLSAAIQAFAASFSHEGSASRRILPSLLDDGGDVWCGL